MNIPLFQIFIAVLMVGVAFVLIVAFRNYKAAASQRRMESMLRCVGLDPAIASRGDNKAMMKEIRQRCRTCASEDLCERWLAGDENGENSFCPNSSVFEFLKRNSGVVG